MPYPEYRHPMVGTKKVHAVREPRECFLCRKTIPKGNKAVYVSPAENGNLNGMWVHHSCYKKWAGNSAYNKLRY